MTERDLTRVMTEHVADVHLPDEALRSIRMAAKEEKPVKKKMSLAVAMVMVFMLLASAAVAAEMGIFDFLSRKMGQEVLPEATGIVQSAVACGETDYVAYNVKQAVYDGKSVSLMVEMRAKDEQTLLLPEAWDLDLPYGALACNTDDEALQDSRTIAEYAQDNGYTRILEGYIGFDLNSDVSGVDEWKDNVITVMYSLNAEGDVLNLPFTYAAYDKVTGESWQTADELVLTAAEPLWQVSSEQTFDLPEYGIRIEGLTVTGTVLQSYWEVRFVVTDVAKAESFHWFDLLTAKGEALPRGVLGVGGSKLPSDVDEQRVWCSGFGAVTEAPAQLMLRVRDVNGVLAPVQLIFDLK